MHIILLIRTDLEPSHISLMNDLFHLHSKHCILIHWTPVLIRDMCRKRCSFMLQPLNFHAASKVASDLQNYTHRNFSGRGKTLLTVIQHSWDGKKLAL